MALLAAICQGKPRPASTGLGFQVELALSDEQLESLTAGLKQVFRDTPILKAVV